MESVSAREFSTAHQLRILCLLAVLGVLFAAGRELGSAIASLRAAKQLHEVPQHDIRLDAPIHNMKLAHVAAALVPAKGYCASRAGSAARNAHTSIAILQPASRPPDTQQSFK